MWVTRIAQTIAVQGSRSTWLDTGIVIASGEQLEFAWDQTSYINFGASGWPPEGQSQLNRPGCPVGNVYWLGMAGAIRADGSGPPTGVIQDGYAFDPRRYNGNENGPRYYSITTGGRLWLIANDDSYNDNSGAWNITVIVRNWVPDPPAAPALSASSILVGNNTVNRLVQS